MPAEKEKQEKITKKTKPGIEISPRAAESRKAVIEKLKEKRDKMIDDVKETFDKRVSYGGEQMTEMAKHKILIIRDAQIREIVNAYNDLIKEFDEKVKKETDANLEELAQKLLKDADNVTKRRLEKLKTIIGKKVEGEFMGTLEVATIDRAMEGMKKFEKEHPELHGLFVKIGEGGKLDEKDYKKIIALTNVRDLVRIGTESKEALESISAGLLISIMSSDQRYEFVSYFMDHGKKEDTPLLIDALLNTGILTKYQGEGLFKLAVQKGVLSNEQYTNNYKQKIESNYYNDQLKQYSKVKDSKAAKEVGGKFSKNIVERFVGRPLLHSLIMAWGATTALVNILASREKGDIGKTLENIASNEYAWLGAGAAAIGYEGATGTLREGRARGGVLDFIGIGEGNISAWLDKMLSDEDRESIVKRNAIKMLAQNYLSAPADLRLYLENGGHSTILKLKKEKEKAGVKKLTLDELIKNEDDAGQRQLLKNLQPLNSRADKPIDRTLFGIGVSAEALDIDEKKEKMADWLAKIKKTQQPT